MSVTELMNAAISRLENGIQTKESLRLLFSVPAHLEQYTSCGVRGVAEKFLDDEEHKEHAQRIILKLDLLEAEQAHAMEVNRKMMGCPDIVELEVPVKEIAVITLDSDEDERKKRKEKKRLRKERRKRRLAMEAARAERELERAIGDGDNVSNSVQEQERLVFKFSMGDHLQAVEKTEPTLPPVPKIDKEIPEGWNVTMMRMEAFYKSHVLANFSHRLHEKTEDDTFTSFHRRLLLEQQAGPTRDESPRKKSSKKRSSGPEEHPECQPSTSRAPYSLDVPSTSSATPTLASSGTQTNDGIRPVLFRFPRHIWSQLKKRSDHS